MAKTKKKTPAQCRKEIKKIIEEWENEPVFQDLYDQLEGIADDLPPKLLNSYMYHMRKHWDAVLEVEGNTVELLKLTLCK